MNVKEVALLVGISIRTLHHYDDIGLLHPDDVSPAGYRQYSEQNLQMLQHILFFKEIGFSLKEIKYMIENPNFDSLDALELQRKSLLEKRNHYDDMIRTIESTIQHIKGEIEMSAKEKFSGLQFDNTEYEQEARQRWGDQKVDFYMQSLKQLSPFQKEQLEQEWNDIYKGLAQRIGSPVSSPETEELIQRWYTLLNTHFGTYSYDAFAGLGQMYTLDERFTKNIDQYGAGLAQYMNEAMAAWASKMKS